MRPINAFVGVFLLFSISAFADQTPAIDVKSQDGLKLVTHTLRPTDAVIGDAYKIQYAVKTLGGKEADSVSEFNGPIILDHYEDSKNIPIVEMKVGGKRKFLVRVPRDISGAKLKKGDLVLIEPKNLTYVDQSVKYTILITYLNVKNEYARFSNDTCVPQVPAEVMAVRSVFPELSQSIQAYIAINDAELKANARHSGLVGRSSFECSQADGTPFEPKYETLIKQDYRVTARTVKPEIEIKALTEEDRRPAQNSISARRAD